MFVARCVHRDLPGLLDLGDPKDLQEILLYLASLGLMIPCPVQKVNWFLVDFYSHNYYDLQAVLLRLAMITGGIISLAR